MANTVPAEFRPYVSGEEKIGEYIRSGSFDSSPYWNGVGTAAENFNHLLAYTRKPVINQNGAASIPWTTGVVTWAKYIVRIPDLPGRSALRVEVNASASAGTFEVRGTIGGAATSAYSTATGGPATVTIDVDFPNSPYRWQILTLEMKLSTSGNFLPTSVYAYQKPLTAGGTTITFPASGPALYTPQDPDQYGVDMPLTVAMMGDMSRGCQALFKDTAGAIVNWSYWHSHAVISTADVGAMAPYDSSDPFPAKTIGQYIYVPREGVTRLKVFAAARLDNYSANPGKLTVWWKGSSVLDTSVDVSTATTDWTSFGWELWELSVRVPQGNGPFYLDLRGRGSSEGTLYIQSFAAFEDEETIT